MKTCPKHQPQTPVPPSGRSPLGAQPDAPNRDRYPITTDMPDFVRHHGYDRKVTVETKPHAFAAADDLAASGFHVGIATTATGFIVWASDPDETDTDPS